MTAYLCFQCGKECAPDSAILCSKECADAYKVKRALEGEHERRSTGGFQQATGQALDQIGKLVGVTRAPGESDMALRDRARESLQTVGKP
jgi:hypothetical protein